MIPEYPGEHFSMNLPWWVVNGICNYIGIVCPWKTREIKKAD